MAQQNNSAMAGSNDTPRKLGPGVNSIVIGPDGVERECHGIYLPQSMQFTDDTGAKSKIFMDLGTHERARKLAAESNWEELKEFPKYGTCLFLFRGFKA